VGCVRLWRSILALLLPCSGCHGHAVYEADSGQVAPSSRSTSGDVDAAATTRWFEGREPHVRSPRLREGAITVDGRLSPEIIQRIVRSHFSRFRLCYEDGLRDDPNLEGKVTVKFIIDQSGAVSTTDDDGSDIPDQSVVQCVVREFGNLSFPQPEGGTATVVYPITMSPSVD
jgi:hypothetical protein